MFARSLTAFVLIGILGLLPGGPALAQTDVPTGSISGSVTDAQGAPIANARVDVTGPRTTQTRTDAKGVFSFPELPQGLYAISISKPGYANDARSSVAVLASANATVSAVLTAATFTSLREIASVTAAAHSSINTGTSALNEIPAAVLKNQGDPQVKAVLVQTPGVSLSNPGIYGSLGDNGAVGSNGATMAAPALIQIRGALQYETASLIDGHPLILGRSGSFDASYLNSYLLQGIEVVKGPGAIVPNVNYAVGGTVNYRTLEPTVKREGSFDLGVDRWGGQLSNYRATGTFGHLGYAFDYVLSGSPGPMHNYPGFYNFGPYGKINGVAIDTNRTQLCNFSAPPPQYQSALVYSCDTVVNGYPINTDFFQRAGLAKLRYNFSPSTAMTVSYIGSYENYSAQATANFTVPFFTFTPPAGYTGPAYSNAASLCCNSASNPERTANVQGVFQAELRSTIANDTVLARYYRAGTYNHLENPEEVAANVQLYGGPIYLTGQVNPVVYNGETVNLDTVGKFYGILDRNHQTGYTFEYDHPMGNSTLSASYDYVKSSSYSDFAFDGGDVIIIPDGSGQSFRTFMLRGNIAVSPKLDVTLGNYFTSYTNHFTSDGTTFQDSTTATYLPRLGVTWRPKTDTFVRFAAGASIAPPYIVLVGNPTGPPSPNSLPVTQYYTQTLNSGTLRPELAFAYDLGADRRLNNGVILSVDLYQTNLRDQYLNSTSTNGTYQGLPLYVTSTGNLGRSRYEGVEFGARKAPESGLGFVLQGAFLRAYPYDLPASIYSTQAGPNTTNLAVIPNVNFYGTGEGFNAISAGNVPYAQGYAELNYRNRRGFFGSLGATYFGNHNSYNEPAFWVAHATLRKDLTPKDYLQVSADNITGTYSQPYYSLYGGVPVPLANGKLGAMWAGNIGPTTVHFIFHHDL